MADPITRSGSTYSLPRDANRVPVIGGVSSADGDTATPVEVNPTTGRTLVDSFVTSGLLPISYNYIGFTNADGNGNYQTITFKTGGSGGTTVATLTLTYDASSNVTSIAKS